MKAFAKKIVARLHRPTSPLSDIGVHFGPATLQLVQLDKSSAPTLQLAASASAKLGFERKDLLERPHLATDTLKALIKSSQLRGHRAISAIPPDLVRVITVTYSASGDEDAAVAALMQERLDGPLSDYVLDYVPIRDKNSEGEQLALVAAAKRADVVAYLDILSAAGLDVDRLEIAPVAIGRLVQALTQDASPSNALVINTGTQASYLTMLSGRRLLSDQSSPFAETPLLESLSRALEIAPATARELVFENGLSPAANADETVVDIERVASSEVLVDILRPSFVEIAREIEDAFVYASSETRGDRDRIIYLLGSVADWPGVVELLSQYTRTPVRLLGQEAQSLLPKSAEAQINPNGLLVATGLALAGVRTHA